MPVHELGQGLVPVPPDQLPTEFVVFCDEKINIPLWKDVPGVNVLRITFSGPLRSEFGSVIGLLRPG